MGMGGNGNVESHSHTSLICTIRQIYTLIGASYLSPGKNTHFSFTTLGEGYRPVLYILESCPAIKLISAVTDICNAASYRFQDIRTSREPNFWGFPWGTTPKRGKDLFVTICTIMQIFTSLARDICPWQKYTFFLIGDSSEGYRPML